jgi:ubiquinone/menaquinone biosynthesis C-methylase UbiE
MVRNSYSGESAYTRDIASSYEEDRKVEEHWREEQSYAEMIIKAMPAGSRVLDIPVGTGRFFDYYQANDIQVVGIDISESMLVEARKKAESSSIKLFLGDARSLDYPDKVFDFVLCWRLLHLLPTSILQEVICELARVASGKLYVQAYVRDHWYYPLKIKQVISRILSKIRSPFKSRSKPWSHIRSHEHSEAMLIRLFSEHGLRITAIDALGVYGVLKVKVFVLEKV